ncbi:MAG: acyl-ACP--UDP-N-acetylglucosamine O-acyltransferase [Elusimicrobia bacterium]|nr:acyl-ACP--UDP-N-acetylglucosamine O-acyltransferase [Elusimicrobiota bacterium]
MIHQTAIIDSSAQIEENVSIGPYAVIGKNTVIKSGVSVGSHSVIECAEIGENCRISSHASIGAPPQDLKYAGEDTKIIVGKNTVVREFVTLNRGTAATGKTVIGSNCMFMATSHVAHDCTIGDNVIFANGVATAGHSEVGEGSIIGGMVGIHQYARIGAYSMLGAGAMVSMDIIPYAQAQGDRARLVGLNIFGMKRRKMSLAEINEIKDAYKILFTSKLTLEDSVAKLMSVASSPAVKEILNFISSSKRGIARP